MKHTLAELAAGISAGIEIPALLQKLVSFALSRKDFFAGNFEPHINTVNVLRYWFGDNHDAMSQIVVFGCNGDGSLYALWLYGTQILEQAPVVFLGSEGTDNTVVASNITEFIQLLLLGIDDLGFVISHPGWSTTISKRDTQVFSEWAEKELGIIKPSDPERLVRVAIETHADFNAWLDCSRP